MARLCQLDPDIDYGPVAESVRRMNEPATPLILPGNFERPFPQSESRLIDDETTVTFYEMLEPDVRAILLLTGAKLYWHTGARAWRIKQILKGQAYIWYFEGGSARAWNSRIGFLLTNGRHATQEEENDLED